jgi:hypothetical protein
MGSEAKHQRQFAPGRPPSPRLRRVRRSSRERASERRLEGPSASKEGGLEGREGNVAQGFSPAFGRPRVLVCDHGADVRSLVRDGQRTTGRARMDLSR